MVVKIHALASAPKTVKLEGQLLKVAASLETLNDSDLSEFYDAAGKVLYVRFKDTLLPFEVTVDK